MKHSARLLITAFWGGRWPAVAEGFGTGPVARPSRDGELRAQCCFGGLQALTEEVPLRFIAGEGERGTEMTLRRLVPLAAQLALSERRPIKRVRFETITVRNCQDLLKATVRTIALSDCDRPVEGDYRRWPYRQ